MTNENQSNPTDSGNETSENKTSTNTSSDASPKEDENKRDVITIDVKPIPGVDVSESEKRANFKLYVAGGLAISLWVSLIVVMFFNIFTINQLSQKLATISSNEQSNQATYIKDAIAANNDTAKTLYTFLTPLAAGITGYFWGEAKKEN